MENHTHRASEKFSSGTNVPYWIDSVPPISYQKLALDKEVDVVIIGGGIAGITIAYCLAVKGKKVAVVEDGFVGSGETGRTTAHLVTALDDRYYELERIFGVSDLKKIAESHAYAIDFIERTIQKENIKCDFERLNGFLFLHPSDKAKNLEREEISTRKAGIPVERTRVHFRNGAVDAIKFTNQAQFHPLKYLTGLSEAIIRHGGSIYTNTHAKEISNNGIVTDEGLTIKAKHVVVATNSPVNNKFAPHLKQYPNRTYVIGFKIKTGSLPPALYWDTGDFSANQDFPPYHYVRTHRYNENHDVLIVGGEDHAVGLADAEHISEEERYGKLQKWADEHFENLGEVIYRWSGQVLEPMDALAYIGHNPGDSENVFMVSGDSGNGMTHGTIAGKLITDLILENKSEWEEIYSPSRFKFFKTGKTFFKAFMGGLIDYIKTKPKHLDSTGIKDLMKNEGKIVNFEGKKLGAFRDEDDNIHFVAPECTHMGCLVKWNNDEKSWDCPCHGSRFTFDGEVLNGPANEPLAYFSQNKNAIQNI